MKGDKRYGEFLTDTYNHFKPVAVNGKGEDFMKAALSDILKSRDGIVANEDAKAFVEAIRQHRFWNR